MKYSFLFGAGAEKPFGLPSGLDFVIKSLIKKNKVLVNYLKKIIMDIKFNIYYMQIIIEFLKK